MEGVGPDLVRPISGVVPVSLVTATAAAASANRVASLDPTLPLYHDEAEEPSINVELSRRANQDLEFLEAEILSDDEAQRERESATLEASLEMRATDERAGIIAYRPDASLIEVHQTPTRYVVDLYI